jgi:hypothetical protein
MTVVAFACLVVIYAVVSIPLHISLATSVGRLPTTEMIEVIREVILSFSALQ